MKIKNVFLAGLLAISFAACSDDDKSQFDPNSEVDGYLSIVVATPETKTEAGTEGREAGVGDENKINDVTIVLTDNSGVISKIIPSSTTNISGNTTSIFKVGVGSHFVYALVNADGAGLTLAEGTNIQRVITGVTDIEATAGYKSGNFLMTNEKHDAATQAGIPVTITSANTSLSPAKATIAVDRIAVKIVAKASTPAITDLTAKISDITAVDIQGYLLLNGNKGFNLIQSWGTTNTNSSILPAVTEALQTPLYGGAPALVKDQYFNNISEYTTLHKTDVAKPDSITSIEDLTKTKTFYTGTAYTTENRPTILTHGANLPTAGRGETTGVIYKVQAKNGGTALSTFYTYRGIYYTTTAAIEAAHAEFAAGDLSSLTIPQLRAKGVKVYEDGIMYYTYFILGTNNNANHLYNGKNYYGVFRNSVYNLTINTIKNIGDDVPGGGLVDPENPGEPSNPPIDVDDAYIQVTITVNDWVLNTIGIDF